MLKIIRSCTLNGGNESWIPGGSQPRETKLNHFSRKWKSSHVRFYNFLLKHEYLKKYKITAN